MPGGDYAALERAVLPDHVQGGGGAAIDNDEVAAMLDVGADGVNQAVRARFRRLFQVDLDTQNRVLADHQRLRLQVSPGEVSEIEQGLRHHAGDDHRVDVRKAQRLHREELIQPDAVFVGRAAGVGGRAPLGGPRLPVVHGEEGVGVALLDSEEHQPVSWGAHGGFGKEHVSGGDAPDAAVRQAQTQRAVGVETLGDPFDRLPIKARRAGCAEALRLRSPTGEDSGGALDVPHRRPALGTLRRGTARPGRATAVRSFRF